jgi:hypothetical protein
MGGDVSRSDAEDAGSKGPNPYALSASPCLLPVKPAQ